jgi:glycosyltransferase involved in cell wall biosynthesis
MATVSIICAAYNCADYLPDAINSVISQDYENWELIIINDCSTDNTLEVANEFTNRDSRIRVQSNRINQGPAKTRNKGIENATGDYLTFLDGDDFWEKEFISSSINFLRENNYSFCFASYYRVDQHLEPILDPFIVPEKVSYNDLLKTCPISCLTAFMDIDKIGKYYMPDIEKRQDYGLWLKILKDVEYAYGLKKILATYRIREGSVSRNKYYAILYVWKLFREVEKLPFLKSLYLTFIYAYNGYRKYS